MNSSRQRLIPLPAPSPETDPIYRSSRRSSKRTGPSTVKESNRARAESFDGRRGSRARRALKADGLLIFLEHGRAPDPGVAAWQNRLTPVWKRFTGGCHLNWLVDELVTAAGFRIIELTNFNLRGPRLMTYIYQGTARPNSPGQRTAAAEPAGP